MWQKVKPYIVPCALPLGLGLFAAWFTKDYMSGFVNPPFAPPAWIFPIVWTILYFCMGISSGIVYAGYHRNRERALILYALQLILNVSWSIVFFRFSFYGGAIAVLLGMILIITAMTLDFYKISALAGWLNIPYLYWCFFALYLNIGVYMLN